MSTTRKLAQRQQKERDALVKYLTSPPAGDSAQALEMAHYARRLQRRMDEDRKDQRMQKKAYEEELELAFIRQQRAEAGASFRWEAESLAFRTALKVLNLDAEALLQRYLGGAQDYLQRNDPLYGVFKLQVVAQKAVADPAAVLVHTTEKDMTDGK